MMKFKSILVVAALLLALIATAKLWLAITSVGRARQMVVKAELSGLATALDFYKAENGLYPTTEQGLDALVHKPESSPIPKRWTQHLRDIQNDPWHHAYVYRFLTPMVRILMSYSRSGLTE